MYFIRERELQQREFWEDLDAQSCNLPQRPTQTIRRKKETLHAQPTIKQPKTIEDTIL